jgi:hypothetical protein
MPNPNIMHRTAGGIAKRVLGEDNQKNRRLITHWICDLPPERRPIKLFKDGRTIYCWEHDLPGGTFPAPS